MSAVQSINTDIHDIEVNEKDSAGRPCKYESHIQPFLQDIKKWIEEGYTDYSIADSLGIHYTTYSRYKRDFTELANLYTRTQAKHNKLVFNSMLKKATGIKEKIKKQKVLSDGTVVTYEEEVYVPPCHNAADLYERNHNPNYKGSKDIGNVTLNQYNFNRPQLESELHKIEQELKQLESVDAVEVEVIEKE